MSSFKEIVTKAIIGKGRKATKNNFQIQTEEIPNTILGCWVINHRFNGINNGNMVRVDGSYDVNVWYSYDNDSKTTVSTKTINYSEEMSVRSKEGSIQNSEIIVRSLQQPTVTDVHIKGGLVDMQIEGSLGVELVGDSKFKVMTDDNGEDEWDDFDDEPQIEELEDNYIKDDDTDTE